MYSEHLSGDLNNLPLYAYRCTKCGHKFEKIQNFSAEPERECPKCGGPVERPLTAPRLQFKGAGWYVNDYASKSSDSASESAAESKSSETKEPAKASESPASAAPSAPAPSPAPAAPPATSTPGTSS
jgi:putative FmdB family regulatory protein